MTTSQLTYVCTTCDEVLWQEWDISTPQAREIQFHCDASGQQATYRLAGLGPISRKADCPPWCTDHRTWRDGTEEHVHKMVYRQGWHQYLRRWDSLSVEICQLEDRPDIKRKDETVPNINGGCTISSLEDSRIVHALIGHAIALLEA